jgi:hypothetical protein
MWFRQPGLIFKVLRQRELAIVPGIALAQSSNEAAFAESSNDDAVCSCDYENSVWHSSLAFDCRPFASGGRRDLRTFIRLASCATA